APKKSNQQLLQVTVNKRITERQKKFSHTGGAFKRVCPQGQVSLVGAFKVIFQKAPCVSMGFFISFQCLFPRAPTIVEATIEGATVVSGTFGTIYYSPSWFARRKSSFSKSPVRC
ncbi:MAG: hypothetical protein JXA11_09345, partial [Phycisphaerae bacterium]|nr:hypothetical protein [Phycisphaerae bacterium]